MRHASDPFAMTDNLGLEPRPADRTDRMIPMINIVFLLLTFFLAAGTFRAVGALKVAPPEVSTTGSLDTGSLILTIDRSGRIALQRKQTTLEGAIRRIKAWLIEDEDGELQIKADRALEAGLFLPILARLRDAGIGSIRLIAVKQRPDAQ